MPTKPLSHSERQRAVHMRKLREEYDKMHRRTDPLLRQAQQIRSSGRWRKVRAMCLARNGLCADPYGKHGTETVTATECDHIVPIRVAPQRAYDLTNIQPLCSGCHARKNREERSASTTPPAHDLRRP